MLVGWRRVFRAVYSSRVVLLSLLAVAVYLFTYFWRLGGYLPASNSDEFASRAISINFSNVWHEPINVLYSLVQSPFLKLHGSSLLSARLPSGIMMVFFAVCLYYLIKNWFGRPAAFLGVVIFIFNPYSIILGRVGAPLVMIFW